MEHTSNIIIGDEDSFDLDGPFTIRECTNDLLYPISLEGMTKGGHDVAISLTHHDVHQFIEFFSRF